LAIWLASIIVSILLLGAVVILTHGNLLALIGTVILLLPIMFFVYIYMFMKLLKVNAFKAIVLVILALLIAGVLDLLGFEVVSWITPLIGIIVVSWIEGETKFLK